jgi:hypothetical protein
VGACVPITSSGRGMLPAVYIFQVGRLNRSTPSLFFDQGFSMDQPGPGGASVLEVAHVSDLPPATTASHHLLCPQHTHAPCVVPAPLLSPSNVSLQMVSRL